MSSESSSSHLGFNLEPHLISTVRLLTPTYIWPYGDEVTPNEQSKETTSEDPALERGRMAFVAYQSNIEDGFVHMQINMVNSPSFPTGRNDPGSDPIVGYLQTDGKTQNTPRPIKGLDFTDWNRTITMKTDFIVSRGGEYFFTPPISALITPLSK
ncbi:dye-decolorizing heme-containing peroxidase [Marasmius tenuissimus]|nr:dye-decolorizing heme-containing peroxidase [Marasmius tenuissimus]